ncbi:hypothetical protein AL714_14855 [Clostridium botulinum]|uniref:hypothetical protein n=1 Tax=Clostridium botulinum TaxID=1491 RepID=UPI00099C50BA|nr:hypothetical protein [Clostridium botulinum]MCC5440244.1 hypothetical protein [Clostridium botulinum]NFR57517.1 hypothetical protein [Clostridium botulinum]OPD36127.1 hypothetical protein AL714_14855 [Clostridium botulinum]
MEFTIEDILDIENNGRQFICLSNGTIVKNVDGILYYSQMIEFIGGKKVNNTIHLKRTKKDIIWSKVPLTMFWIKSKYKRRIDHEWDR